MFYARSVKAVLSVLFCLLLNVYLLEKIIILNLPQRHLHVDHRSSAVLEDKCRRKNWLRSLPTNLTHRA